MAKRKGPTWDQIHEVGRNNIEQRESGGYERKYSEAGRTRVVIKCPFCTMRLTAYLWSLNGCGKRCDCGAMCDRTGTFYHFADRA